MSNNGTYHNWIIQTHWPSVLELTVCQCFSSFRYSEANSRAGLCSRPKIWGERSIVTVMMAKMTLSLDMAKAACSDLDIEKKSRYHSVKVGVCQALSNDGRLNSTFFSSLGVSKDPDNYKECNICRRTLTGRSSLLLPRKFQAICPKRCIYIYIFKKSWEMSPRDPREPFSILAFKPRVNEITYCKAQADDGRSTWRKSTMPSASFAHGTSKGQRLPIAPPKRPM